MDENARSECFCGCGRAIGFGRARGLNGTARRMQAAIAAREGASTDDAWLSEGFRLLESLRVELHGDVPLDDELAGAVGRWWDGQAASADASSPRDEMSSLR